MTTIEVKKFARIDTPFGHNWAALVIVNGEVCTAIKQGGGLNFWAFKSRSKLSRSDQQYVDDIINEELAEEQRLNGEIA